MSHMGETVDYGKEKAIQLQQEKDYIRAVVISDQKAKQMDDFNKRVERKKHLELKRFLDIQINEK